MSTTKRFPVGSRVQVNGSTWFSNGTVGEVRDSGSEYGSYYIRGPYGPYGPFDDTIELYIEPEHVSKAPPQVKLVGKTWHCKL